MSTETEQRERRTAKRLAAALTKAGYDSKAIDHGYAVRIFVDGTEDQLAIVWLPIGEPTPTGLGNVFLWGRTGDEHQAPETTDMDELVPLIVSTLS